uniref:Uncharacterized protein n=1 Tax=Panagrolaimus sp. PS1159 TaxID=55785 RepID=A0AC35G4K1_9BILA
MRISTSIFAIIFIILQTAMVSCKPFSRFNYAEIENELQNFHQNPFEAEAALGGNEEISEKDLELLGLIGKELKEMRRSIPEEFFNPNANANSNSKNSNQQNSQFLDTYNHYRNSMNNNNDYKIDNM